MIEINYQCEEVLDDEKLVQWESTIELLTKNAPFEALITGYGNRYHIVYSKCTSGYYLVIPEWYIGCEMSKYNDVFWNKSAIKRAGLTDIEAETIAKGISHIKAILQF